MRVDARERTSRAPARDATTFVATIQIKREAVCEGELA
jgi:hypothetical protein